MHFTRYFQTKTWNWNEIGTIKWNGPRLKVVLKYGWYRNGTMLFWVNPFDVIRGYQAQKNGEEPFPPLILDRIAALPLSDPPQVILGPLVWPYPSYPMFLGLAPALLIAIARIPFR